MTNLEPLNSKIAQYVNLIALFQPEAYKKFQKTELSTIYYISLSKVQSFLLFQSTPKPRH